MGEMRAISTLAGEFAGEVALLWHALNPASAKMESSRIQRFIFVLSGQTGQALEYPGREAGEGSSIACFRLNRLDSRAENP